MTSSSSPQGGAAGRGRERRRFPRFDVEIAAIVRKKAGDIHLVTADVSRHGAFLRTDSPAPVRQLVQIRFRVPAVNGTGGGDVDAMCMVARSLGADSPRGAGMGVDFFALSKDAKAIWERFVFDMKARDAAMGFDNVHTATGTLALPPSLGMPMPALSQEAVGASVGPNGIPTWMAPNSLTGEVRVRSSASSAAGVPPLPGQALVAPASDVAAVTALPQAVPPPPPPDDDDDLPLVAATPLAEGSVVILRLPDREHLRGFVAIEVERGGMFLRTPLIKEVGEKIDVVLVHPDTDEEFRLDGTVVRRVITGPAESRGLGIFFKPLGPEQHAQLDEFVESGVEVVELGTPLSDRQIELEAAVAREPDSAEALEQLGTYLLDEEGDLGGALTALTRALVLGPSQVSIHASLARAYRRIGDPVRVRAHERVAEALMLFQDRMKVRMGVGDE